MRVVPKAFIEFAIEKNPSRDSIRLRCLRTNLTLEITSFEIWMLDDPPPSRFEEFGGWIRAHFLHKPVYLVRKR